MPNGTNTNDLEGHICDFLLVFLCNYVSVLYCFRYIINYFIEFKWVISSAPSGRQRATSLRTLMYHYNAYRLKNLARITQVKCLYRRLYSPNCQNWQISRSAHLYPCIDQGKIWHGRVDLDQCVMLPRWCKKQIWPNFEHLGLPSQHHFTNHGGIWFARLNV